MYGQEKRIRKSKGNIWFIFLRILLFPRVFRHAVKDIQKPEMNDFEVLNMSRLRRDCQPALPDKKYKASFEHVTASNA